MGIDAIHCTRTFYTLEALKLIVETNMEFGRKSHEKLLYDIMEYRNEYITKLKRAIYDYTALVIFGEMRHGAGRSTHYNPVVPEGGRRQGSYDEAREYNPTSILIAGEKLFGSGEWRHNYGGKKWKFIANRVLLKDSILDNVYCDMCFSLSHNTSPYLDKDESDIFAIHDVCSYKALLDYKFSSEEPLDVIGYCLVNVGSQLKNLVRRAVTLNLVDKSIDIKVALSYSVNRDCDEAEEYILNYVGREWGNTWLPSEVIQHRETLGYNPMSLLPTTIRDDDEIRVGDVLEVKHNKLNGCSKIKKGMLVKVVGKTYWGDLKVKFREDVGAGDLDGRCEEGYGIVSHYQNFKKHIA